MKEFIKNISIKKEYLIIFVLVCITSLFSSFATYYFMQRKIPQFAVVDLISLNNESAMTMTRYLMENNASEDEVSKKIKTYSNTLELILSDIHKSGNYVLLQKQTVVSDNLLDLTPEIEKALFEAVGINKKTIN